MLRMTMLGAAVLSALFFASAASAAPSRYIVIQNLNPPHDCRVLRADMMFIQIYSRVFGPATKGRAERFARTRCRAQSR